MSDSKFPDRNQSMLEIVKELGMIKFGFVAQAIIGLTFQSLGAKDIKLKSNSHPDITFYYVGKKWRVEVEVMGLNDTDHTIKKEDLKATMPVYSTDVGCIALFDLNIPCRWYVLDSPDIWKNGERTYAFFELRNNIDLPLSETCTHISEGLVIKHQDIILRKGYHGLVSMLKGCQ